MDEFRGSRKPRMTVPDIRQLLSEEEFHTQKEKIDRAERILEEVKGLLTSALFLHNGKLSAGTIDYAAFRIETLSLMFEVAFSTFRQVAPRAPDAHEQFLTDLGDQVGFTFARDLISRLTSRNVFIDAQDMKTLLELWASFENDTGAGVTKVKSVGLDRVIIQLRNNPLRRIEERPHSHCGFYRSYLAALLNEIYTSRARILEAEIPEARVHAQKVVRVTEQPDTDDECTFILEARPERLVRSFDAVTRAYDTYFRLAEADDYWVCMNDARGSLVTAQLDLIGLDVERAPRQAYKVYQGILSKAEFKRMDESFQRVSRPLHPEAKSSSKLSRQAAWALLKDVRRSVYAFEFLELNDAERYALRNQALVNEALQTVESLLEKAEDLRPEDRAKVKALLAEFRKEGILSDENQVRLVTFLRSASERLWEVVQPVISDLISAAARRQLGL